MTDDDDINVEELLARINANFDEAVNFWLINFF